MISPGYSGPAQRTPVIGVAVTTPSEEAVNQNPSYLSRGLPV